MYVQYMTTRLCEVLVLGLESVLDLEKDGGLPVVQFGDLVVIEDRGGVLLNIPLLHGICERLAELGLTSRREGGVQCGVARQVAPYGNGVLVTYYINTDTYALRYLNLPA